MMKRRDFLKFFAVAPVAAPAMIAFGVKSEAVKVAVPVTVELGEPVWSVTMESHIAKIARESANLALATHKTTRRRA